MIFKKKLYIKGMDVKQNKNRSALALIASFAIGFSLCACGSENVAGGGPSGTEAGNAITAQIFIANAPAANARVKLVEQNSLDGNGYIATANENGFVTIKEIPIGNYTMEASLNESSVQLPVSVQNLDDTVELGKQTLQKSVYIGGNVSDFITDSTSEKFKNATGFVKFRGLDHSAIISNGKFEVLGLPAGKLSMVILPSGTKHDTLDVSIKVSAGDSLTTLKPQDTIPPTPVSKNERLLIDDFEDGDFFHSLAKEYTNFMFGGGQWAINTNPAIVNIDTLPGSFKITPVATYIPFGGSPFTAVIQDDGNGGKEVHFTIEFPDTSAYKQASAIVKVDIGNSGVSYDLSPIDSIAFEAWGQGSTDFVIIDATLKDVDASLGVAAFTIGKTSIELTQEKKKLKFALADILPNEEKRKSVTTMGLVFHSDAELHFDNLEFIGKDLLNIWKSKE
ncbi:MAG: carboxypeptidase regulatory-like domain-containing protein [Fibrobacter sp.]|nr:carboxypeptidase regulatory-like domain-containing protein [Fibrobacter sp.]MBR6943820.1 carboxypeptidase regulatory-like domain-containing protein [Fibrobacter sp.]